MKPIKVSEDLYWVGAIDYGVRDFHGYVTKNGTTYNNYLLVDRDVTLFDAVHKDFFHVSIDNIRSIVDPKEIKNFVVNHIEPDHSGAIEAFLREMPQATVFITERGKKGLKRMFDIPEERIKVVKNGESLNTGKYTLLFIETPMLHWPDSMVTYITELKTLITQDAFGFHFASTCRFDDEFVKTYSEYELEDAIYDYYANILMPFGNLILKKVEDITKLGIEIKIIAPDHGVIWRSNPEKVLKLYTQMAEGKAECSITIIYDTMWHATERMVFPIVKGIEDEGVKTKVVKLRSSPMSEAVKEFWKGRGMLVGTPTLNNSMFPSVAEFLYYLSGLKPRLRMAGAFGSYGWSGGGVKDAYEYLKKMGLETVEPGIEINYGPTEEDKKACYEFGRTFAKKVREYHRSIEGK
ncbi:MAG: FprA family A-type flavoprotein [Desulfobacterota bacterium]|nr:FprA family A-type flavoprotein [Thermodesulfobacteriota bacterium]MDW8001512.1 FprA family A-type flavoprotein [Deltaproteobacteria bacterium]